MAEMAGRYVTLRRQGKEMVGPCPICRAGDDRFWVRKDGQSGGCRKCGFAGDMFDLMAKVEAISLGEAAERLSLGIGYSDVTPIAPTKIVKSSIPEWKSLEWQSRAKRLVAAGKQALNAPGGVRCQDYIYGRSLSFETSDAMQFGYSPGLFDPVDKSKRPALLIPWIDGVGTVFAIKYRYIDDLAESDKGRRFRQHLGSDPILFGLNTVTGRNRSLIAVEGEVNAATIYQATHRDKCDVVSIGSKRNQAALDALDLFITRQKYARVLVWLDEHEDTIAAGESLKHHRPKLMKSPYGLDANDVARDLGCRELVKLMASRFDSLAL